LRDPLRSVRGRCRVGARRSTSHGRELKLQLYTQVIGELCKKLVCILVLRFLGMQVIHNVLVAFHHHLLTLVLL
jgi:hypothetical protein